MNAVGLVADSPCRQARPAQPDPTLYFDIDSICRNSELLHNTLHELDCRSILNTEMNAIVNLVYPA